MASPVGRMRSVVIARAELAVHGRVLDAHPEGAMRLPASLGTGPVAQLGAHTESGGPALAPQRRIEADRLFSDVQMHAQGNVGIARHPAATADRQAIGVSVVTYRRIALIL